MTVFRGIRGPTDAEWRVELAKVGIGAQFATADSSFAYESAPNISHATNVETTKTLCGLDCSRWHSFDDVNVESRPDCRRCERVWRTRGMSS